MKRNRVIFVASSLLMATFFAVAPGYCQDDSSQQRQPGIVEQQLTDNFKNYDANYIGVATAKDAYGTDNLWEWYWDKKAHINITRGYFWGDDAISQFFQGVSDKYIVPFWNVVMESEIVRVVVLLVLAGIPIGSGIRLLGQNKKGNEEKS